MSLLQLGKFRRYWIRWGFQSDESGHRIGVALGVHLNGSSWWKASHHAIFPKPNFRRCGIESPFKQYPDFELGDFDEDLTRLMKVPPEKINE